MEELECKAGSIRCHSSVIFVEFTVDFRTVLYDVRSGCPSGQERWSSVPRFVTPPFAHISSIWYIGERKEKKKKR